MKKALLLAAALLVLVTTPSVAAPRNTITCAPGWGNLHIDNQAGKTVVWCDKAPLRTGKTKIRKAKKQRLAVVNTSDQFAADVVPFKR